VRRAKILVVDDEADLVEIVRVNLEGAGYEVAGARNGVEGLRLLKEKRPDLVILDVLMPELDGWEVLRRIRRDRLTAATPVVMLSSLDEDDAILRGLDDGAVEYVTKPFQPENLVASVKTLLEVFDPAMREERRAWLVARQHRKVAEVACLTIVEQTVYTRSSIDVPLRSRHTQPSSVVETNWDDA
jgi:DNA-binding response OmpR family regulator